MTLGEQLDHAKLVRFDPHARIIMAWYGGYGINCYLSTGHEVAYGSLSVSDFYEAEEWMECRMTLCDYIDFS